MPVEAYVTIAVAVAGAFGAWMFRVDRGITKLVTTVETLGTALTDHVKSDKDCFTELYDDRNVHDRRLTKLETRAELTPLMRRHAREASDEVDRENGIRHGGHYERGSEGRVNQPERDE